MPPPDLPAAVSDALAATGVAFEVLDCDPAYADTAAFCERYGYPLTNSANTIVVASTRGPEAYAACVVAADKRLDVNHTVRRTLGFAKVSFADGDATRRLTGMELGGVTVFGLPSELPLLVDEPLLTLDYVILGAGTRSAKIKARPEILAKLPRAEFTPGLSR